MHAPEHLTWFGCLTSLQDQLRGHPSRCPECFSKESCPVLSFLPSTAFKCMRKCLLIPCIHMGIPRTVRGVECMIGSFGSKNYLGLFCNSSSLWKLLVPHTAIDSSCELTSPNGDCAHFTAYRSTTVPDWECLHTILGSHISSLDPHGFYVDTYTPSNIIVNSLQWVQALYLSLTKNHTKFMH